MPEQTIDLSTQPLDVIIESSRLDCDQSLTLQNGDTELELLMDDEQFRIVLNAMVDHGVKNGLLSTVAMDGLAFMLSSQVQDVTTLPDKSGSFSQHAELLLPRYATNAPSRLRGVLLIPIAFYMIQVIQYHNLM